MYTITVNTSDILMAYSKIDSMIKEPNLLGRKGAWDVLYIAS
jgi:hypothetical protein